MVVNFNMISNEGDIYKRNPAQKVSAQKVSGHKVSKIDNIGQTVSSQNYQNKDNAHYYFSYNIF